MVVAYSAEFKDDAIAEYVRFPVYYLKYPLIPQMQCCFRNRNAPYYQRLLLPAL